jgi:ABC-type amino acid transport substrate-binding protein
MITDGIEVRLQEQRRPELKGTMSEPFTRTGKALLLPPASELTERIDAWLNVQIERGELAGRLEQAMERSL